MPTNQVAQNVLGTIGAVCWTVQLIPQIWKSWRSKSTDGLSLWLVWLWGISGPFLGVYAVVRKLNVPLILQPQLFMTLCLVSWAQCLYYGGRRSRRASIVVYAATMAVVGAFEAGMIFAVRPAYRSGNNAPVQFFGIMSSVIISLALLPQYYEIYKHGEVVGISTIFMLIDCLGGVFSDLSLAFQDEFDVIAAVTYSLVVVLDGVVLLLALYLNPRAERRRKKEIEMANALTRAAFPSGDIPMSNISAAEAQERSIPGSRGETENKAQEERIQTLIAIDSDPTGSSSRDVVKNASVDNALLV